MCFRNEATYQWERKDNSCTSNIFSQHNIIYENKQPRSCSFVEVVQLYQGETKPIANITLILLRPKKAIA